MATGELRVILSHHFCYFDLFEICHPKHQLTTYPTLVNRFTLANLSEWWSTYSLHSSYGQHPVRRMWWFDSRHLRSDEAFRTIRSTYPNLGRSIQSVSLFCDETWPRRQRVQDSLSVMVWIPRWSNRSIIVASRHLKPYFPVWMINSSASISDLMTSLKLKYFLITW